MALRVWLPLNGNLENKGTSLIQLTSGTPTYTNGKIGQCLTTGSLNFDVLTPFIATMCQNKKYTIMCWCKDLDTSASGRMVFSIGSGTGTTRGLWETNNSANRHWAFSGSGVNCSTSINPVDGKWHHICFTINETVVTLYVDGTKQGAATDSTTVPTAEKIYLQASKCDLNDFRLYDEVLSPKQIKEISKGLVCHYKLEGMGANPNLFKNTLNATHSSSGAVTGSSSSANFSLDSTATAANLAGKQVTISVDIDAVNVVANEESGNHRAGTEIAFSRSGGGTTYLGAWQTFTDTASTVRKKLTATGTIPSDWTGGLTERNMYIQRLASGTVKLSNLKIEIGGVATDWTPSVDDAIYSKLGFNNMLLTDVSGNGYNATKVGTLNFDSTAPRYNGGSSCTTGIDGLKTDLSMPNMSELTISFWVKPNASSGGYCAITTAYNLPAGTNAGLWIAVNCEGRKVWAYLGAYETVTGSLTNGTWYHCVYTFNNGISKWYINGVEQTLAQNTYTGTTMPIRNLSIGNTYTGSQWNTKNYGSLSDFRLYATALSAADVKQLYDTAGIVDNANNMYAYEFKEE